ncbi:peroxisomal membrane protein Pex13p [Monosporozyma unispora]|nr:Peroxisomal membrane protein PAS20 [Kazachstania unispora]
MNSTPRPKPWETSNGDENDIPQHNQTLPPEVPPLPEDATTNIDSPNNNANNNNNNTSMNSMGYTNSSYGGGMGMYGNANMYGNTSMYGNSYGGGMGLYGNSYGGMYGNAYSGYGTGMNMQNGFNSFGMNGPGIVTESTMATFQLLENLIGAINGFAQMLESSYMATYNSFFTLVSFAEELGRLKQLAGSLFGMFNIVKLFKKVYSFLKGKRGGEINSSTRSNNKANSFVEEFQNSVKIRDNDQTKKTRGLAWKPLILFFMGVFGFPYLLKKYINRLQNNHIKQLLSKGFVDEPIDPMNLEFAKATYDFIPENPTIEITLKKGDLMAIISKKDTTGKESSWWRVRTKQGDVGYVPSNYIEIIKRRKV